MCSLINSPHGLSTAGSPVAGLGGGPQLNSHNSVVLQQLSGGVLSRSTNIHNIMPTNGSSSAHPLTTTNSLTSSSTNLTSTVQCSVHDTKGPLGQGAPGSLSMMNNNSGSITNVAAASAPGGGNSANASSEVKMKLQNFLLSRAQSSIGSSVGTPGSNSGSPTALCPGGSTERSGSLTQGHPLGGPLAARAGMHAGGIISGNPGAGIMGGMQTVTGMTGQPGGITGHHPHHLHHVIDEDYPLRKTNSEPILPHLKVRSVIKQKMIDARRNTVSPFAKNRNFIDQKILWNKPNSTISPVESGSSSNSLDSPTNQTCGSGSSAGTGVGSAGIIHSAGTTSAITTLGSTMAAVPGVGLAGMPVSSVAQRSIARLNRTQSAPLPLPVGGVGANPMLNFIRQRILQRASSRSQMTPNNQLSMMMMMTENVTEEEPSQTGPTTSGKDPLSSVGSETPTAGASTPTVSSAGATSALAQQILNGLNASAAMNAAQAHQAMIAAAAASATPHGLGHQSNIVSSLGSTHPLIGAALGSAPGVLPTSHPLWSSAAAPQQSGGVGPLAHNFQINTHPYGHPNVGLVHHPSTSHGLHGSSSLAHSSHHPHHHITSSHHPHIMRPFTRTYSSPHVTIGTPPPPLTSNSPTSNSHSAGPGGPTSITSASHPQASQSPGSPASPSSIGHSSATSSARCTPPSQDMISSTSAAIAAVAATASATSLSTSGGLLGTLPTNVPYNQYTTGLVYDSLMLKHQCVCGQNGFTHPEHPGRLQAIWGRFHETGLAQICERIRSRKATLDEIQDCHSEAYTLLFGTNPLNRQKMDPSKFVDLPIKSFVMLPCGGIGVDSDTTWNELHTGSAARMAAGCVIELSQRVACGKISNGFALVRPPGHHAEYEQAMGFCFFNSIAIATKQILDKMPISRVMIVDLDVHHGNGMQQAFYRDSRVLYLSLHRHDEGNFFPGTGAPEEVGEGDGRGFNVNIGWYGSLNPPMGDAEYLAAFRSIVMPIGRAFDPQIVMIACGFDAARGHPAPLGGYLLTPAIFGYMTRELMSLAGGRVVASLEGGYDLNALCDCAQEVLASLLGISSPTALATIGSRRIPDEELSRKPCRQAVELLQRTVAIQSEFWPGVKRFSHLIDLCHLEAEQIEKFSLLSMGARHLSADSASNDSSKGTDRQEPMDDN